MRANWSDLEGHVEAFRASIRDRLVEGRQLDGFSEDQIEVLDRALHLSESCV
ncbi:MAG TPA: hypothetical protein VHA80_01040 [Solirubrobacterales bacterium]|nr:hypothetical protein [Solirubrobacterales bacterium]